VAAPVPDSAFEGITPEARSDCAHCPVAQAPPPATAYPWPWRIDRETRCCTFHPTLFNFLLGRALARGGDGAERVLARIAMIDGVTHLGIGPPAGWLERFDRGNAFGRDVSLRCPYWVRGEYSCSIWLDRPSVCRAWHCRHDHGPEGSVAWKQLGLAVNDAEEAIARRVALLGTPPAASTTDVTTWADWYRSCAERAETLDVPANPAIDAARADLVQIRTRRPALPDLLVPAVSAMWRDAEADSRVLLAGYSPLDSVDCPPTIFVFLAKLDGATPWRTALTPEITEHLVAELVRVGALKPA
jgi:hypothetical protein